MSANIKVSGTWREASGIWVKVSGTWQDIQQGWIKVGGTFQQFFGSILYMQSRTISAVGVIVKGSGAATAVIVVESAGTLAETGSTPVPSVTPAFDGSEWVNGGTPADYHVRVTATGDTGSMGGLALNTWYACTADRAWNISVSGGAADNDTATLTFEYSDDGGSTVLDTFTDILSLNAQIS